MLAAWGDSSDEDEGSEEEEEEEEAVALMARSESDSDEESSDSLIELKNKVGSPTGGRQNPTGGRLWFFPWLGTRFST